MMTNQYTASEYRRFTPANVSAKPSGYSIGRLNKDIAMTTSIITEQDLVQCRRNFAPPGMRHFSFIDKLIYLNIYKPFWCDRKDDLRWLFKNKWDLLENGNVVWAHLVQANELLFEYGNYSCPASVVFSPSPKDIINLDILAQAAGRVFDLKHTTPTDPVLLKIARALTDEFTRTFGVKLPDAICSEHNLYEATCFISQKHLPNGILSGSVFPVIISQKSPYFCVPLPSRYWTGALVDYWYEAAYS